MFTYFAQAAAHSEAFISAYRMAYAFDAHCVERPVEAELNCIPLANQRHRLVE